MLEPVKCKACNLYPVTYYRIRGGWKYFKCPKCGQKSKSYQNKIGCDNAVKLWNNLNEKY